MSACFSLCDDKVTHTHQAQMWALKTKKACQLMTWGRLWLPPRFNARHLIHVFSHSTSLNWVFIERASAWGKCSVYHIKYKSSAQSQGLKHCCPKRAPCSIDWTAPSTAASLWLLSLSTVVEYVTHKAISDSVVIILPQALGYLSDLHILKNSLSLHPYRLITTSCHPSASEVIGDYSSG